MKIAVQNSKPAPEGLTAGRMAQLALTALLVTIPLTLLAVSGKLAFVAKPFTTIRSTWATIVFEHDQSLGEKISIAISAFVQGTDDALVDIPQLVIDVPFEEMREIYAKRNDALARGYLIQAPDDFVDGDLRFADRTISVKLRLKGDWSDHLAGRKWSFRIHTRQGEQWMGLRRFSIQNPNTRAFQAELLFFETLRKFGILAPRYQFANVTLNGESMGIMAIEEFFAKELMEFNGRKESVIVRFDESYLWGAKDSLTGNAVGFDGAFDSYLNARIDAFGSSRIAESPELTTLNATAVGLLRGFVDGSLPASDVFDTTLMGQFIAVADAFGSWHALRWHNVRFYLNPITLRLEPIGYDATLQARYRNERSAVNASKLAIDLMGDPQIFDAYAQTIIELGKAVKHGTLLNDLRTIEAPIVALLRTEFRSIQDYPLEELITRTDLLSKRLSLPDSQQSFTTISQDFVHYLYPTLLHVADIKTDGGHVAEIRNAVPREVMIDAVNWVNADGAKRPASAIDLPVQIAGLSIGSVPVLHRFELHDPPAPTGWTLTVTASLEQHGRSKDIFALPSFPAMSARPIPEANLTELLSTHPFLSVSATESSVYIEPGVWDVKSSLNIPVGLSLVIDANTTLRFAADAALIVRGPLKVRGSTDAPVVFEPLTASGWPGLVVLEAGARSLLQHAHIIGMRGVSSGSWALTGGVVFYKSDVRVSNSVLTDSRGEDALNIVHSQFELLDTTIDGTASDALDADFSSGSIRGGRFANIRGDAIDISGSTVTVSDSQFESIFDKALSVGEGSQMTASNITIANVGSGAAVKDGSQLDLSDAAIDGASFAALTAYIKKPEYGPAAIVANRIAITGALRPTLAQTGSRIALDGNDSPSESLDVEALYETVMRPELQK